MIVTLLDNGAWSVNSDLVVVPDYVDHEYISEFIDEGRFENMKISEVKSSDIIMRFFRIFFPNMQVEQDNDGQVVIYTGIFE